MPSQSNKTLTLKELADVIAVNEKLPSNVRAELRSAISTFARTCSRAPSEIIADPGAIRALANAAPWQLAKLSKASWANTRSRITRALEMADIAVHRRRRNFKLGSQWAALFDALNRRDRDELHRFAGYCSVKNVQPSDVTVSIFEDYLRYLTEQSIIRNPRERWHVARRAWNRGIALPNSGYVQIPNNERPDWRGLNWNAFPASLMPEIAAYRKRMTTKSLFDGSFKPLAKITVDGYLRNLRVAASRLVEDGASVDYFSTLKVFVEPGIVRRAMELQLGERDLKEALPGLQAIAIAALSIGKFVNLPDEQQAELKKIFKTVRHRQTGMTKKNRDRLAQFEDREALLLLLDLPSKIEAEYREIKKPSIHEALRMQLAVALEVLLHVPMRVKNLAALDLERHINKPIAGKIGNWRISIPAEEVKNGRPIEAELNDRATKLIALYVAVFRPVLRSGASTAIFLSQAGGAKGASPLSKQFAKFIKREIGVTVNAHLMRHLAAFIYLEEQPGDYETVRQLLSHKQITTTASIYAGGAESKNAWARFDSTIERRRSKKSTNSPAAFHDVEFEDLDKRDYL